MLTLGIDLSTKDSQTAACFLDWRDGPGRDRGVQPYIGLSNEHLLDMMEKADRVAVDAPFGWPDEFIRTVSVWGNRAEWLSIPRERLRYRQTDRFIIEHGRTPLSVSADRIASTAMRCAELLQAFYARIGKSVDRVDGRVVEAYPAAAFMVWGFDVKGYKDGAARDKRRKLVDGLIEGAELDLSALTVERCETRDDALDALVCSLVARATDLGLTHQPNPDDASQIGREGWIQLPRAGSLSKLAGA